MIITSTSRTRRRLPRAAGVLLALAAGCGFTAHGSSGDDDDTGVAPTVISHMPISGATNVPAAQNVIATFSEPMDPATLTTSTFTVTSDGAPVPGTVFYADSIALFLPDAQFISNGSFTATITTGARSATGYALATDERWSFSDNTIGVGHPVPLGTAGNYAILAKTGITATAPTSAVTGNLGVSPIAATAMTGLTLVADPSNMFSTSTQVSGRVYAADYEPPTPANLTLAVGDMEIAATDAAARTPDITELGAGNIGGMTLPPAVYRWGTGLLIPTSVTLHGTSRDVWIFQVAQGVTMSSATSIVLTGGAQPKNIYWQVAGPVTLGTTAHFEGIVLAQTSVTLMTGATINGRLLAQTAVGIAGSMVVQPL